MLYTEENTIVYGYQLPKEDWDKGIRICKEHQWDDTYFINIHDEFFFFGLEPERYFPTYLSAAKVYLSIQFTTVYGLIYQDKYQPHTYTYTKK